MPSDGGLSLFLKLREYRPPTQRELYGQNWTSKALLHVVGSLSKAKGPGPLTPKPRERPDGGPGSRLGAADARERNYSRYWPCLMLWGLCVSLKAHPARLRTTTGCSRESGVLSESIEVAGGLICRGEPAPDRPDVLAQKQTIPSEGQICSTSGWRPWDVFGTFPSGSHGDRLACNGVGSPLRVVPRRRWPRPTVGCDVPELTDRTQLCTLTCSRSVVPSLSGGTGRRKPGGGRPLQNVD